MPCKLKPIQDSPDFEGPIGASVTIVTKDHIGEVLILKAEFRMSESQAFRVMITAHQQGLCVVAVFARDIAETKAARATEAGRNLGYPLLFTTIAE